MRFKTTKKAIMNGYDTVINVGNGNLQSLLSVVSPIAYTCGSDGWHSDVYQISHNIVIVSGYQPFGNVVPQHACLVAVDDKARIILNSNYAWSDQKNMINMILADFISEVVK